MKQKKKRNLFKQIWDFLWNSDSILSWVSCIILLFVLVVFIILPLLRLFLSTSLPLVIVESASMEHQGDFEEWWYYHGTWYLFDNISKKDFLEFPYPNGLDTGDILLVRKVSEVEIGKIIIFYVPDHHPLIHRVVTLNPLSTKGDNNHGQINFEMNISTEQLIGEPFFRIPRAGYIKIIFCKMFPPLCNLLEKVTSF